MAARAVDADGVRAYPTAMGVTGETWPALALASIFVTPFVLCLVAWPWLVRARHRHRTAAHIVGAVVTSDEVFNPEASAPTMVLGAQTALPWAGPHRRS